MDKYETLPFTVAPLGYLETSDQWTKEKPYYISGPLPPEMEAKRSNIRYKDGLTKFYNLRGHEHTLNMDEHGIEIHRVPSKVPVSLDFKAQDNTAAYMEETGKWLKDKFNAKAVLCYAYRYRTTDHSDEIMAHEHDIGSKLKPDSATGHPHTDHTLGGGPRRVRRHMTSEEADEYLDPTRYRIRIMTVWRPIGYPVEDSPLTFCDYRTVKPTDLVASDRVSEQYVGEINFVTQNEDQRWFWIEHQTPDEVSVFTSYDTHPGNGPKYCVHGSFRNQEVSDNATHRQSVEVRTIIVTPIEASG